MCAGGGGGAGGHVKCQRYGPRREGRRAAASIYCRHVQEHVCRRRCSIGNGRAAAAANGAAPAATEPLSMVPHCCCYCCSLGSTGGHFGLYWQSPLAAETADGSGWEAQQN